jgi:hypothetical protein
MAGRPFLYFSFPSALAAEKRIEKKKTDRGEQLQHGQHNSEHDRDRFVLGTQGGEGGGVGLEKKVTKKEKKRKGEMNIWV